MASEIIHTISSSENLEKEYSEKFNEYRNIVDIEELSEIVEYIKEYRLLKMFDDISDHYSDIDNYSTIEDEILSAISFFEWAKLKLNSYDNLKALIYLIFINYKKYNPGKSPKEVIKKCAGSEYIIRLTLQDIDGEDYEIDSFDIKTVLGNIDYIKFENDDVSNFNDTILGYLI